MTSEQTKLEMKRLYVEEGLTSVDIAPIVGLGKRTVVYHLSRMGVIRSRGEASRMRATYGPDNPGWGEKPFLLNGYPARHIRGRVRYLHRMIAEEKIGRELKRNEIVHHVNGDRSDNRPENLEVMTRAEHARLHALENGPPKLDAAARAKISRAVSGKNNPMYGKTPSAETKRKIAEAHTGPRNWHWIPTETLLEELRNAMRDCPALPAKKCRAHTGRHPNTYINRFGSWSRAKEAARASA